MPWVGVEPTRKRFLRPPPLPLGYHGSSALSRSRTCNNVTLDHAPLPSWAIRANVVHPTKPVEPEGVEPSFPGCKPGVFPLDDGPNVVVQASRDCTKPSVAGRDRTFS